MSDAIVRLKITLADTEPPIWRRVEVPAEMTLKDLHAVIQAAMGWDNAHLYLFHVGRETIAGPGMGGEGFGMPRAIGAGRVRLDELAARGVKRFAYEYDMGDSWEHRLQIEKLLPTDPAANYPRFIDGAMHCPPEDVGGIPDSTSSSMPSPIPNTRTMRTGSTGMAACSIPPTSTPTASTRLSHVSPTDENAPPLK